MDKEPTQTRTKHGPRKVAAKEKPLTKTVAPKRKPLGRGKGGELRRDQAAEVIREQIMAGSPGFRSGDILTETQLRTQLGLTLNPVRQALSQLANEGLVTVLPRVGTQVRIVRPEEAQAILAMRYAIETVIVGELARTRTDFSALESIIERMKQIAKHASSTDSSVNHEFAKADMDFHATMAKLANGYSTAAHTLRDLTSQYFLYASHSFQHGDAHAIMQKVVGQHAAIVAALKLSKSNPAKAAEARALLHDHLKSSADRLAPFAASYLSEQLPTFFGTN